MHTPTIRLLVSMSLLCLCASSGFAEHFDEKWRRGAARGLCTVAAETNVSREAPRLSTCPARPTREVAIAVNLDPYHTTQLANLEPLSLLSFSNLGHATHVTVHDLDAQPIQLELRFQRGSSAGQWTFQASRVEAGSSVAQPAMSTPLLRRQSGPILLRPVVEFDDRGNLIDPNEIEQSIEYEDGRQQMIRFSFETARGRSTQYAMPSVTLDVEVDSFACDDLHTPRTRCGLAPGMLDGGPYPDAERFTFASSGHLVSSEGQAVVGRVRDIATGKPLPNLSRVGIPAQASPPAATRAARILFELDESRPVAPDDPRIVGPIVLSSDDRLVTIPFSYFDGLGGHFPIQLYVFRASPERWIWYGPSPRLTRSLGALGGLFPPPDEDFLTARSGEFVFDDRGVLEAVIQSGRVLDPGEPARLATQYAVGLRRGPITPPADLEIDFRIGESYLGSVDLVHELDVDGHPAGIFSSLRVSGDGELIARSSSGIDVLLATFATAEGDLESCSFDCSNGRDDDRDRRKDYPDDPGCSSPLDLDERSPRFACDDGIDNDGDGQIDFPADRRCLDPEHADERPAELRLEVVMDRIEKAGWRKNRRARAREWLVAVLNDGNPRTLAAIDETSLRVVSRRGRSIMDTTVEADESHKGADANCDAREDRLFRIHRTKRGGLPKSFCLTGIVDLSRLPNTSLGGLRGRAADPFEFEACTPQRR